MRALVLLLFPVVAAASPHPVFERERPREERALATLKRLGPPPAPAPAQIVCARVEFTVRGELPPRLAQGFFSRRQKAPALLRFQDLGPAGLSAELAVMTGADSPTPDMRLDFRLSSHPLPPANDVVELAIRRQRDAEGLWAAGAGFGLEEVLRLPPPPTPARPTGAPYQKSVYHGELPYRLGPLEAVRYRLRPCAWNPALAPGDAPGALAREFRRHLSEDSVPACFELEAQVLEAGEMRAPHGRRATPRDWIENAAWPWPEAEAPFRTLADVRVKPGVLPFAECRDFAMNPDLHSTPDHRALGSLARARRHLGR